MQKYVLFFNYAMPFFISPTLEMRTMKMLFLWICNDNPLIFVHWFSSSSTLRVFFIHGYDFPSL